MTNISKSYSCERQDEFIANLLPISNGKFLDIACSHPVNCNNTYLLEALGWSGLAFDLEDWSKLGWNEVRKTKFFKVDATSEDLTKLLINNLEDKAIDYLSLDVDIGGHVQMNLSHLVLPRILDAGISFKCATIEHEAFNYGVVNRDGMRNRLLELGYTTLFADIQFPDGRPFEDWWIDPKFFSEEVKNLATSSINYNEAVELIKNI